MRFLEYIFEAHYQHDKLNPKLFQNDIIRSEVKEALLKIAKYFQDFSKIPDSAIKDIILTGSNCNYNYNMKSDIDLHIVINKPLLTKTEDADMMDDYIKDKKSLWNLSRHIKVRGYNVELYVQDASDKLVASGIYSILNNQWISKPVFGKKNFTNDEALEKKIKEFHDMIEEMIQDNRTEEDFKIIKNKIKDMRKAALASGGENAFDNLVFKGLRNSGIFDKMNKYLQNRKDLELSLEMCLFE
jgi:hypothetical protein